MRIFQKFITANFLILSMFSLTTFLVVQITIHIYNEQLYQKTVQVLGEFTTGVYNDLKSVEEYSLNTAMNLQVQNQLVKILDEPEDYDEFQGTSMLKNQLLLQSLSADFLTTVSYVDTKGKSFTLETHSQPIDNETIRVLCDEAAEAKGGYIYIPPNLNTAYIYGARQILEYTNASLRPLGTLLFACDLNEIIRKNYKALPDEKATLCIYADRQLIYEHNPKVRLASVHFSGHSEGYYMETIQGKVYFVAYIQPSYSPWTFVSILPYGSMFQNIVLLKKILMAMFVLLFLVSILLNFRVSRIITRPLEDLTMSMRQAETGDFQNLKEELFDYDRTDEVGCLQKDFLKMFQKINRLIQENYHSQMVIQDTKYRALQSQIEPHFLYNTLSSINWLAMAGKNEEISQMVLALSGLLRAAINQKPVVSLDEEVQLLEYYVYIQKIRYEGRVLFHIEIPEAHRGYRVPGMILQPIVENSIQYGVENMLGVCTISVYSEDAGDDIRITIRDNGPGMDADLLEKLRRFELKPRGTGIGLRNIHERLRILFGPEYGLQIESQSGRGTQVTFQVPKRTATSIAENIAGG